MAESAFERLYKAAQDSARLEQAYDRVVADLFHNPFWNEGPTTLRRVLWSDGRRARVEDRAAFGSPGLYLWGSKERPVYIGITRGTFDRRFYRYIWSDRSQCNLAKKFEPELCDKGIDAFPAEVTNWYARNFGASKVRLRGAARFAKEGIDDVWFALFPHSQPGQIRELERALVDRDSGAAVRWGRSHHVPLLNVQN